MLQQGFPVSQDQNIKAGRIIFDDFEAIYFLFCRVCRAATVRSRKATTSKTHHASPTQDVQSRKHHEPTTEAPRRHHGPITETLRRGDTTGTHESAMEARWRHNRGAMETPRKHNGFATWKYHGHSLGAKWGHHGAPYTPPRSHHGSTTQATWRHHGDTSRASRKHHEPSAEATCGHTTYTHHAGIMWPTSWTHHGPTAGVVPTFPTVPHTRSSISLHSLPILHNITSKKFLPSTRPSKLCITPIENLPPV